MILQAIELCLPIVRIWYFWILVGVSNVKSYFPHFVQEAKKVFQIVRELSKHSYLSNHCQITKGEKKANSWRVGERVLVFLRRYTQIYKVSSKYTKKLLQEPWSFCRRDIRNIRCPQNILRRNVSKCLMWCRNRQKQKRRQNPHNQ